MNLKKQIRRLLALEFLSNFHLAGTAWVALLALRGYSPVEIGLAEGFFHIVSLCGEIPSGMLADLLGRKKTLAWSQVLCALAAAAMMTSRGMVGLCLGMALTAVSYNLVSGTREALTYDSLLQAGEAGGYLRLSSTQNVVYRVSGAAALCGAGLAVKLGHVGSYALDILFAAAAFCVALSLAEPVVTEAQAGRTTPRLRALPGLLLLCARDAAGFLRACPRACALMLFNALIGAGSTLLGFFLQSSLVAALEGPAALGPLLVVVALGNVAGSRLAPLAQRLPYWLAGVLDAALVCLGVALGLTGCPLWMAAGGFLAGLGDDCFQLLTDARLNAMIPSDRRATLISVSSMSFSVVMIALSPLAGLLFTAR